MGEPVIGFGRRPRWSLGGLRRRWGWATCAALVTGVLGVPLVWGNAALPVDIPMLDNVAWLPSDAQGDVVRVNGETGEVDARLDVGADGVPAQVEQSEDVALVDLGGEVRAIDVARLRWGRRVQADGEVVVGEGAAYLVQEDGVVRALDPESLVPAGEVRIEAELGPGVVAGRRLIVPGTDGRLHVVDRDGQVSSVAAGDPQDDMRVSLVGDEVVAVNLTAGVLRRFELNGGELRYGGEVGVEVPAGEVVVPSRLPAGRLWLLARRSGELYGIDLSSGRVASVRVTTPRADVSGPVVAGGRVYVVDRADGRLVEVDAETLDIVDRQALDVEDASQVDVVVQGETVFVNDRASSQALVINGDEQRRVDKGDAVDVPSDGAPEQPPQPLVPPPPGDDGRDDRRDDRPATTGPSTTITVVPGVPSTTTTAATTTTTLPPTTTTTTRSRTPPGAVAGLSATADDGMVTLQWGEAPSPLPVTYTIAVSPATPEGTTVTTTATSRTFTGLTNGVTYRFTVTPTNSDGAGQAAQTDATPVAPTVPPDVVGVSAEAEGTGTYRVIFEYTSGSATSTSCTVSQAGGETRDGFCDPGHFSKVVGGFTIPAGQCADFTVTLTTELGTDSGTATACAPAPATTTTTLPEISPPPQPQGTPCTVNGQPASCHLAGGGG